VLRVGGGGGGYKYFTTVYQQNKLQTYIGLLVINLKERLDYFRGLNSIYLKPEGKPQTLYIKMSVLVPPFAFGS
jgi:hypothetical protein